MIRSAALICLLVPSFALGEPNGIIESLIRDAWVPQDVRVEWEFRGKAPAALSESNAWQLCGNLPKRIAGNLILRLCGQGRQGEPVETVVAGRARIFGQCWTVSDYVSSGQSLASGNIVQTELEWTHLIGAPVIGSIQPAACVATRGLVPGRPICTKDLKAAPVVRKGQQVTMEYRQENVLVAMHGRALTDGSPGEVIPIKVELDRGKRLRGAVVDSNTVRYVQ